MRSESKVKTRTRFCKNLSWEQTNLNNWSKIWISSGIRAVERNELIYFKPALNPPQNLPAPCSCQRLPWFFQCFFIFLDWLISCIEQSLSRLHALLDWWPEQQSVSWRQRSRNPKPKHIERRTFGRIWEIDESQSSAVSIWPARHSWHVEIGANPHLNLSQV